MCTSQTNEASAVAVKFVENKVVVELEDQREIGVPLARFPFLEKATPEQRGHWALEPRGFAIYWPDLDDGIEVAHLLSGQF
jgi:hypothetical protein